MKAIFGKILWTFLVFLPENFSKCQFAQLERSFQLICRILVSTHPSCLPNQALSLKINKKEKFSRASFKLFCGNFQRFFFPEFEKLLEKIIVYSHFGLSPAHKQMSFWKKIQKIFFQELCSRNRVFKYFPHTRNLSDGKLSEKLLGERKEKNLFVSPKFYRNFVDFQSFRFKPWIRYIFESRPSTQCFILKIKISRLPLKGRYFSDFLKQLFPLENFKLSRTWVLEILLWKIKKNWTFRLSWEKN